MIKTIIAFRLLDSLAEDNLKFKMESGLAVRRVNVAAVTGKRRHGVS